VEVSPQRKSSYRVFTTVVARWWKSLSPCWYCNLWIKHQRGAIFKVRQGADEKYADVICITEARNTPRRWRRDGCWKFRFWTTV